MTTRDYFEIPPDVDCRRFGEIVERRLGGEEQLSPEDVEFAQLHARECPICGKFSGALIRLKDTAPESLAPSLLEKNIVGLRARMVKRRRIRRVSAFIGAAAALFCLVFSVQFFLKRPQSDQPLPLQLSSGILEAAGAKLRPGSEIEVAQEISTGYGGAHLQVGDGLRIVLDRQSVVLPRRVDTDLLEFVLARGRMVIELDPAAKTPKPMTLRVRTSQLDVVVKGTIFVVEAGRGNDRVHVIRGRVDVSFPQDAKNSMASLHAGWSLEANEKRIFPLDPFLEQEFSELLENDAPTEFNIVPRQDAGAETKEVVLPQPPARTDSAWGPTKPESSGPKPETLAQTPGSLAQTPGTSKRKISKEDASLDGLVRAARQCRAQRDWHCAARSYSRVLELFGHRGSSSQVLLPLAQIELDHLGQHQQALEHFQLYLEGNPRGGLAQEARFGFCRALMQLGRKEQARRELERFVELYPTSMYAGSARKWLESLRHD